MVIIMNLPSDFSERMKCMLNDEYNAFERAFTSGEPYTAIRINTAKENADKRIFEITGDMEQVRWCKSGYYADKTVISGNHPYHIAGLFYFQEPSAMAVIEAADIQKGERVLDLCAAPGGKSTHILSKLCGTGLLVSNEISKKRASILAENVERFGAANTVVLNESPKALEKKFDSFFDVIIVDSPCSGEGMFRKEPQAIDEWSIAHTQSCAKRSKEIVDSALKMLKSGGRLIYSTCTFALCENEGVIDYILSSYPDMTLKSIPQLDMLDDGKGEYINSERDFSATKRIFPHKHKGEGHFIAVLEKNSECDEVYSVDEVKKKNKKSKNSSKKDSIADALELYRQFEKKAMNISLDGNFVLFGENLYRLPDGIESVDGLHTERAGLHLGVCKKGRFEPSQALALAFDKSAFVSSYDMKADSGEMQAYLRGESLEYDGNGWVCVCVDGFPIGWGKASQGMMKNRFPKYLRLP